MCIRDRIVPTLAFAVVFGLKLAATLWWVDAGRPDDMYRGDVPVYTIRCWDGSPQSLVDTIWNHAPRERRLAPALCDMDGRCNGKCFFKPPGLRLKVGGREALGRTLWLCKPCRRGR